jgi:hypothetical protein
MRILRWICASAALCVLATPRPASAQIADNISGFTDENTKGYLEPLRDTFASGLSDGLFTSAHINSVRPYFRLELRAMLVRFNDDDRTFQARPEDYFPGSGTYDVPTVIGSEQGVTVNDSGSGTSFTFPGGLDIDGLALAAPQLIVGGVAGTEAILRYFTAEFGDNELGDINLFGIGGRHSISQYLPTLPVDVAGMIFFQRFSLGDDLAKFDMLSFGVQASKRFTFFEPYVGVGLDRSSMTAEYEYDGGGADETLEVEFDSQTNPHLTLGAALRLFVFHINGEVNVSEQTSYALGLSLGM